ncbi:MAG: LysM peptidoglycan-binding domain-containing protein, partial [Elusimicrobiota bacterium]
MRRLGLLAAARRPVRRTAVPRRLWKCVASAVLALILAVPAAAASKIEFQKITVRPGDTLWSISQKYLKDPKRWDVILRHNKLPTNDPTVALPGMTLRVPKSVIKEDLRAATLVQAVRKVRSRKKGRPAWKPVKTGRTLFNGDGLRTMAKSWARVKFFGGHVLSVEPNSMTILRSPKKADHDLFLNRGAVHATIARVATPSARITPAKGTKYTARVFEDLSTSVQVYKGSAEVVDLKGRKKVNVRAGFSTKIKLDQLPDVPRRIPDFNARYRGGVETLTESRIESLVQLGKGPSGGLNAPGMATAALQADIKDLSVGMPVAAYHIQIAQTRGFRRPLYNKTQDAYESID